MTFDVWLLFGVAVAALLVMLIAMPFYFFSYALERKEPINLADPEQTKGTQYASLTSEIAQGVAWVKEQQKEDWWITSHDGLRLHGTYLPHPAPKGILLMFHGYHSEAIQDFACALPYYHSLGYSMLLADQRAHGQSEGKYITFGDRERQDVVSWLTELVSRLGKQFPIFLDGISMGATTVMLAGSMKLPGNVRGIIADCGFTSPIAEFKHVLRTQFRLPAYPLIPLVQILAKHRCSFLFDSVDTIESMKHLRYPIIFVHGKDDDFVPTEMTVQNYHACRSEKTILLVDGAAHGGSYLADRAGCQKALKRFLETNNPVKQKGIKA